MIAYHAFAGVAHLAFFALISNNLQKYHALRKQRHGRYLIAAFCHSEP
jgi:hypothetical protein